MRIHLSDMDQTILKSTKQWPPTRGHISHNSVNIGSFQMVQLNARIEMTDFDILIPLEQQFSHIAMHHSSITMNTILEIQISQ